MEQTDIQRNQKKRIKIKIKIKIMILRVLRVIRVISNIRDKLLDHVLWMNYLKLEAKLIIN